MKVKSIKEAGAARLSMMLREIWFIVQMQSKVPSEYELKAICDMNGISYDDIRCLFNMIANNWEVRK